MKLVRQFSIGLFSALVILTISCKPEYDDPEPVIDLGNLPAYVEISKFKRQDIFDFLLPQNSIVSDTFSVDAENMYDVKVFKVVYETTSVKDNSTILASGAVLVPIMEDAKELPLISYQHRELYEQEDAPSLYTSGDEVRFEATLLASAGFAVSMPDYIGYGETAGETHPFEHANSLATASYDMLIAAKEILGKENIKLNDSLFLAGYSEGGTATLALHKYIEENNTGLKVTMSAPGNGLYSKTHFIHRMMTDTSDLEYLPKYMWMFHSYNWIYEMDRTWHDFLTPDNDTTLSMISTLNEMTEPHLLIDANILLKSDTVFNADFKKNILDSSDVVFFNALEDNNIHDWAPKGKVKLLYQLKADSAFIINSMVALDSLTKEGGELREGADVERISFANSSTAPQMPYFATIYSLFKHALIPEEDQEQTTGE